MPDTDSAQHPRIYRAISKRRWYQAASGRVDSAAFKLRTGDVGVSLAKDVDGCSMAICVARLITCFGEFVLETERARGLGLQVVDDEPDAVDFSENHAQIIGIPVNPATDDEKRRAEDLATDLAELSTLHHDRRGIYVVV